MKTYFQPFIYLVVGSFSILLSIQKAHSQSNFIGTWQGTFMNDFKTVVNFNINDHNLLEGHIKMIAGGNIIQDDEIINIKQSKHKFYFFIPAKQTSFEGYFNDQITVLSGDFIFPDGSKHAIQLNKSMDNSNDVERYRKLKEQRFSAGELNSDLEFLYSSLKEYHPLLHSTASRDSMEVLVEQLTREIDSTLTLEEFFVLAAKLTDAVHCSHTGVRLPVSYQNVTNTFGNYFPFRLFFSKGKAFYVSGYTGSDEPMSPGQEIISINNVPVDQIIVNTFYFIPSEPFNTTTKYNELNKRFNELFYYLSDPEEFNVGFKSGDSIKSVIVPSVRFEDINLDTGTKDSNLVFHYMNDIGAGFLKIPTFMFQSIDQYIFQLDSIFNGLRTTNTPNLILDLRDNDGGHPIFAAQLFSYLTKKDFVYFKRNDEVKEFEPLYNTMHANELNYSGDIFVLINGGCLSTAGHLISLLKFHTNSIFIGEQPGSSFRCNDFSIQLILPNTGIELNVPRTTFETAVTGFTIYEPFPIDYHVNDTIDKIINNEDAMQELVVKIISNE